MLNHIREVGTLLDDLHIRLNSLTVNGMPLQDVRSFLDRASAATSELRIDVCFLRSRRGDGFLPLRSIPTLGNITELQLCVQPVNGRETEVLAHILNNLGKLTSLRKISCGDWKSHAMSMALRNGLMDCFSVNEVVLSNIVESHPDEIATLLSGIPSHVQSVTLKYISITDMDLVDMCEQLSSLRKLCLVKLPRISSRGIYQAVSLLPNLEVFYCSTPVNPFLLRSVINSMQLKELRELTLVVNTGLPEDYEEMLSRYFFDVCCTRHHSKTAVVPH
ncbi:hypothetical protein OESDEN_12112 [Oesophagostomum dentatum]|uniref:Leucine Rich repeat-containing domain protein n=1 Tax=Oesophagostomum dentatum TaxID=61180 RepID=A0A0B1SS21_OESDE|nr:hypothetical protein OESDEN_12112 [Oesophagostomum dentatum]